MRLSEFAFLLTFGALAFLPINGHASDAAIAQSASRPSWKDEPEQIGRTFHQVGASVEHGAKTFGRAVADGARQFGQSIDDGWRSFRRGLSGN